MWAWKNSLFSCRHKERQEAYKLRLKTWSHTKVQRTLRGWRIPPGTTGGVEGISNKFEKTFFKTNQFLRCVFLQIRPFQTCNPYWCSEVLFECLLSLAHKRLFRYCEPGWGCAFRRDYVQAPGGRGGIPTCPKPKSWFSSSEDPADPQSSYVFQNPEISLYCAFVRAFWSLPSNHLSLFHLTLYLFILILYSNIKQRFCNTDSTPACFHRHEAKSK